MSTDQAVSILKHHPPDMVRIAWPWKRANVYKMDSYFAARYLEDKRKLFSIGCFYNDKNGGSRRLWVVKKNWVKNVKKWVIESFLVIFVEYCWIAGWFGWFWDYLRAHFVACENADKRPITGNLWSGRLTSVPQALQLGQAARSQASQASRPWGWGAGRVLAKRRD